MIGTSVMKELICGALPDLVPCAQFKNVKKTHGGVLLLVTLSAFTCSKSTRET